jgi:hypothetical protein
MEPVPSADSATVPQVSSDAQQSQQTTGQPTTMTHSAEHTLATPTPTPPTPPQQPEIFEQTVYQTMPSSAVPAAVSNASLNIEPWSPAGEAKQGLLSGARNYLPEYFVTLWVLFGLHISVLFLFSNIIDNIAKSASTSIWDTYGYTTTITSLATAIVLVPAYYFFAQRTAGTENEEPRVKTHRWRKGFLAIFLVLVTLALIGSVTTLAYQIVSQLASIGIKTGTQSSVWRAYVKDIFAILLFGFTLVFQSRDYRAREEEL